MAQLPQERTRAYACKLTKTPRELTAADYKALEQHSYPREAMSTFWWLCRGLHMSRVSDGFRLPLERDNVFANFYKNTPPREQTVIASSL